MIPTAEPIPGPGDREARTRRSDTPGKPAPRADAPPYSRFMTLGHPLVSQVRDAIAAGGDPDRARQQQAYMKSAMPYQGLRTAELSAALRPVLRPGLPVREEWDAVVRELWDGATVREHRYAALAVLGHRTARVHRLADVDATLELYRYLVTSGAWWDLVDDVATHWVRELLLARPDRTSPVLREWSVAPDLWLRRTSMIAQVGVRGAADLDLLADVIEPNLEGGRYADSAGRQDFFIRKAIGWVLRDVAYAHPDWVRAYVESRRDRMAGLSIREALKHL